MTTVGFGGKLLKEMQNPLDMMFGSFLPAEDLAEHMLHQSLNKSQSVHQ